MTRSILVVCALSLLIAPHASSQQLVDLGTFNGVETFAVAINEQGEILGGTVYDFEGEPYTIRNHVLVWKHGTLTEVYPFVDLATPYAINAQGKIVVSLVQFAVPRGYVLHNGDVITGFEPVHPNCCIEPYAINNLGQVVGATGGTFHGFIWQEDPGGGGTVVDLGTFGGSAGFASGINNRGQIIGISRAAPAGTLVERAMLLEDGTLSDLGSLGGLASDSSSTTAINERGQIVGWSTSSTGEVHATLWDHGAILDLGTLGGSRSEAHAINDHGQVVGISLTASGDQHAFFWNNGTMIDLGTLGGQTSGASGINNAGTIVGFSETAFGETHAVLWTR